jgi:uncharacterized protein YjbI with pentapeptide repeats
MLARLDFANLANARVQGATFYQASLFAANLRGVRTIDQDHPFKADFHPWTVFDGADLNQADLRGADLRWAQGLTVEQVGVAFWDTTTRWPADLPNPPGQPTVLSAR